jgi:pyruvate formate lyase activating enzyme
MQVNLGGVVHLSTVDWIGSATTVVFLRGCPLRCPHCQNRELITGESPADISLIQGEIKVKTHKPIIGSCRLHSAQITLDRAVKIANAKTNNMSSNSLISGIVISGGEPLMQPSTVRDLSQNAKEAGLLVGLETCGYYPDRIAMLLKENLIDRVFMDVKAALRDPEYEKATGIKNVAPKVLDSLKTCMSFGVPLEVRTTIYPEMPTPLEVVEIARMLSDLKKEIPTAKLEPMTIQLGLPRAKEFIPVSSDTLHSMTRSIENIIPVKIREYPEMNLAVN